MINKCFFERTVVEKLRDYHTIEQLKGNVDKIISLRMSLGRSELNMMKLYKIFH